MTTTLAGIVPDMPETDYHAHPAFSSTQARAILKSSAHYRYGLDHPRISTAFDLGTAVHTRVLGVGTGAVAYPEEHLTPSGNVSTRAAAVAWADEQRSAGRTPISPADMARVDEMAEAVLAHRDARSLLEGDRLREASAFGTCTETGVDLRARFDILGDGIGADLKSTVDASPDAWALSVARYGYHIQEVHYRHAYEYATQEHLTDFQFIVVEKFPPYLVAVYRLSNFFREIGDDEAWRARRVLAACREHDVWPGYPSGVQETPPPNYLIYRHEERLAGADIEI